MVTPMWEQEIRAEAAYRSERVREAMAPRVPRAPRVAGRHGWAWWRARVERRRTAAAATTASLAQPTAPGTADVATESLGLRPA